jgi:hypothetical protein
MSPNHSTLYDGDFIDSSAYTEKEILKEYEQETDVPPTPHYYQPPQNYQKPYTSYPYSNYINPFEYIDNNDDQAHNDKDDDSST